MASIVEIVDGTFIRSLKTADDAFLMDTMEELDRRCADLVEKVKVNNAQTAEEYRMKFWSKIEEVLEYRNAVLRDKRMELEEDARITVEKYRKTLIGTNTERILSLGAECGRTGTDLAEITEILQSLIDRQVQIFEDDLRNLNESVLKKATESSYDRKEFEEQLAKQLKYFQTCDEVHLNLFARGMGDNDNALQALIRVIDSKFRAYLASEIQIMGRIETEQFGALVQEHKKDRAALVEARKKRPDDRFVIQNEKINKLILENIDRKCVSCYGHGKISAVYYELCYEQHDGCRSETSDDDDS